MKTNQQQRFSLWDTSPAPWVLMLAALSVFSSANGFLQSVSGPRRKVQGYQRGPVWPPVPEFFEAGPVGFAYFAPIWFRYYLRDYILSQMGKIESQAGVMQLEHLGTGNASGRDDSSSAYASIGSIPMRLATGPIATVFAGLLIFRCWTIGAA